jgi:hypothetical protein
MIRIIYFEGVRSDEPRGLVVRPRFVFPRYAEDTRTAPDQRSVIIDQVVDIVSDAGDAGVLRIVDLVAAV